MRLNITRLFLSCLLAVLPGSVFGKASLCGPKNATVLVIRHAEKPPEESSSPLLNSTGDKRARKYIDYFKHLKIGARSATPTFVFASKKSQNSNRSWLTVKPLVDALNLPYNKAIKNENIAQLVKLLRSGEYDGNVVLVCWHHGDIPPILDALGANHVRLLGGDKWPKQVFGWIVELQFDANGALKSSLVLNERLMDDDTENPKSH